MRDSLRRKTRKRIAVLSVLVLGISGAAGMAWGGTAVGNGMPAGIAWGQTARLSVLSPAENAAPCPARLQFFDRQGNLLVESTENVKPGQLVSLDLRSDSALRGTREHRAQVYAAVRVDRARRWACRGAVATLEIFDERTLKTEVVVVPPNPIIR